MDTQKEYINISKSYSGWINRYVQASYNRHYWSVVWAIWEDYKDEMSYFEKSEFWHDAKEGDIDV